MQSIAIYQAKLSLIVHKDDADETACACDLIREAMMSCGLGSGGLSVCNSPDSWLMFPNGEISELFAVYVLTWTFEHLAT